MIIFVFLLVNFFVILCLILLVELVINVILFFNSWFMMYFVVFFFYFKVLNNIKLSKGSNGNKYCDGFNNGDDKNVFIWLFMG